MIVEGGCLCGAIRYRAEGAPSNATLCHCRTCRKAAGSPVVAWVTFAVGEFSIVAGAPARFRSSTAVVRTFCVSCGTPLTYARDDQPDTIDVTVCSFDDPAAGAPADHTWTSHRLRWMETIGHLPELVEARS